MFQETAFDDVDVVILGQDPYPEPDKETGISLATGLAFSIPPDVKQLPPSLRTIFKELNRDDDVSFLHSLRGHGDLVCWAKNGALLLNTALTVGPRKKSHIAEWARFTETVLCLLNARPRPAAFLFWGRKAWRWAPLVRAPQHFVRLAGHPRTSDFLECRHFSQVNTFLGRDFPWSAVGAGITE